MIYGKEPCILVGNQTAAENPFLNHPSTCQCPRFLEQLEYEISTCEVNPVPDNDTGKLEFYLKLQVLLLSRANVLNHWSLDNVEKLIQVSKDVIRLIPDNHTDKAEYLHILATAYSTCFRQLHDIGDLDRCILAGEHAIRVTNDDHPERVSYLRSLTRSLSLCFQHSSNLSDIDKGISIQQSLIQLTSDHDPDESEYLYELVSLLRTRFQQLHDPSDLDKGVLAQENAIQLLADDCPASVRCLHLHSLVSLHYLLFKD